MSTQLDVTIIVPTYNLEDYIGAALESIVLQRNLSLEVLVVDDHSTDTTTQIVRAYAKKYSYIHLLTNERTKGVSGARNTGIAHMQGQMCFFLDGDDLLPPNALTPLVEYMREHHVSIVGGYHSFFCHQRWLYAAEELHKEQSAHTFPSGGFWQRLYCSKFIKENALFFPENCPRAQDSAFFCQAFCHVTHIPQINHSVYIYRINHKENALLPKNAIGYIEHFKYVCQFLQKAQKEHILPSYVQSRFAGHWLAYAYAAEQGGPETLRLYLEGCIALLHDREHELRSVLESDLREHSHDFWLACQNKDSTAMFIAMQNTAHVRPVNIYMGIDIEQIQRHWVWKRALRRIKNTIFAPKSIKNLWYIYSLHKKSKKFTKNSK